jgi:hypothetical protein
MECGVPECDIILEDKSRNTAENIHFTRALLEKLGVKHDHILGVHQPFMERRIVAAMGVYWPEQNFRVTSPQVTIPEYLADAKKQGITENAAVSVIVGDFQRMDLYAKKVTSCLSISRRKPGQHFIGWWNWAMTNSWPNSKILHINS